MKKLYILVLSAFAFSSINAQTYLSKDFNTDLTSSITPAGVWTVQEPTPATITWETQTIGPISGPYAIMKNWNGSANEAVESWLISPAVDLSGSTTPLFSFRSAVGYAGTPLEVLISTDYVTGAPNTGTWTPLTPNLANTTGNWFEWTFSGNVDLTTYKVAGVHIAFKYVGGTTDGSTWEIDDILINETGEVLPVDVSIYDIQNTTDPLGNSPYMNTLVSTGGVVTAVRPNDDRYYVQAGSGPWTGVYVYDNFNTPVVGDSVTFLATVTEYNGPVYDPASAALTELTSVANFNNFSSGNTVPTTIISSVDGNTEPYEGVLVTIDQALCTSGTNGFNEWTVNDGTGPSNIGGFMHIYQAALNGTYTVTGIVDYAFGSYLVQPRFAADILDYTSISEGNTLATSVYPNPANEFVNIEAPANSTVTILSIEGKVVINAITNNSVEMIDVSSLESGSYIVSISNNNATSTQVLVKK